MQPWHLTAIWTGHFDARNPRTAIREIPRGIIAPNSALRFVIICCAVFYDHLLVHQSALFLFSPVALFVIYFIVIPNGLHAFVILVLGIGLSLAPIGAFLAVTGRFELLPLLFSGAVICWVSGFDIIYAMQDVDFDKSENLYSIPAAVGKKRCPACFRFFHVLSAVFVIVAGLWEVLEDGTGSG